MPGFVGHVKPVLERRLAASVAPGHTGELKLSFYRDGMRLGFQEGQLIRVERWSPSPDDRGHAAFSGRTFLHLLLGSRSLEELEDAFADCRVRGDVARALLPALFPKQPFTIWPVA